MFEWVVWSIAAFALFAVGLLIGGSHPVIGVAFLALSVLAAIVVKVRVAQPITDGEGGEALDTSGGASMLDVMNMEQRFVLLLWGTAWLAGLVIGTLYSLR